MRKSTINTFSEGLIKDLNPLTTPNTALTDALNATLITYNGNEFVLQNDMGNCKVERAKLSPGFIPIGMKEYGGIVYVASLNPETGENEIGSFPSPERDFSTSDFDNLSPVNFQTSQFVVATTNPATKENTVMVGKLFEPELFVLHPGDKYVVTYTIHDPSAANVPDEIDTEAKLNNYISSDPLNRKLFALKFYKITDNNNLLELENGDIKVVSDQADIENEYVFFKENSNSTLAIGMKLEELDYFDSNIINTSSAISETKKVAIEAVGFSESLQDFKGVRLDVTEPNAATYFIDKIGAGRKVSAIVSDLPANSKFKASLIPYSKYSLFPKLKREYEIDLGLFETFDNINNTYRFLYRDGVSNNDGYMTIDFDYRFQGQSGNGVDIYLEFYDLQENYSLIQKIDNPSYYGNMKVQIELEAKNSSVYRDPANPTLTNPSLLRVNSDTTFLRSILPTTNVIRTDGKLKRNYFYIVRISGIDKVSDDSEQGFSYKHYDIYKGIYTHDMFNSEYNNSPEIVDFNLLDFKKDTVKYTGAVTNISTSGENETVIDDSIFKTGDNYYRIIKSGETNNIPSDLKYRGGYRINKTKSDNINFTLTNYQKYFGTFKSELVQLVPPVPVTDTNYVSLIAGGYIPVEQPYNKTFNDSTVVPDFVSSWVINRTSTTQFNVITDVTTSRKVVGSLRAQLNADLTGTTRIKPTRLLKYGGVNSTIQQHGWDAGDTRSVIHWDRRNNERSPLKYVRDDNSVYFLPNSNIEKGGNRGEDLANLIEESQGPTVWSAWLASSSDISTFDPNPINGNYAFDAMPAPGNSRDEFSYPYGAAGWKANFLIIRTDDGDRTYKYRLALSSANSSSSHNFNDIIEFYDNLAVVSKYSGKGNIYSMLDSEAEINSKSTGVVTTVVDYSSLPFTSVTSLEGGAKTYLSKFNFRANNTVSNFDTSIINNYIASRKLPDTLSAEIRDGFIPYITSPLSATENIELPDLTILGTVGGKINVLISKLVADANKWQDDPLIFDNASGFNHGEVVYIEEKNKFAPQSWVRTAFKARGTIGNPATQELPNANGIYFTFPETDNHTWIRRKDGGSRSATDKWSINFKEWIRDTHNFNYMRG